MTEKAAGKAKGPALALLAMTQFIVILDASIVNVALPSIGTALEFSQDNLSWVVNAYVLTFGGFLLLGGRMADLLGRRRVFIIGLVIFGIASLLGGLAQNDIWLVVARAVQGLGAALISPAALSILTTTFTEGSERNRALGVWGAVAGAGGAAGVLLGGILTEYVGWEWVLLVNTPITIVAAFLAVRLLDESRDERASTFDFPGAISVTAGLALLVYGVVNAEKAGWGSTETLVILGVALALIAIFIAIESRTKHPLMPFSIFRLRTLRGANLSALFIAMALFAMFFITSLYMQQVLGYEPLKAGLAYLPLSVGIILSAGVASQLTTKIGFKPPLVVGALLTAAGLIWFSRVSPDGTYVADVLFPSLLAAVGLGLCFVSFTIAAVMGTKPGEAGLASGLLNTSQQVGGALGLAITATIANSTTGDALAGGERNPAVALTEGFQDAFLVCALFAVVGAFIAIFVVSSKDSREHSEAAARGENEPVPVAG